MNDPITIGVVDNSFFLSPMFYQMEIIKFSLTTHQEVIDVTCPECGCLEKSSVEITDTYIDVLYPDGYFNSNDVGVENLIDI